MKDGIIGFGVVVVIMVACIFGLSGSIKECKAKGGTPVGYYGMDCWDNVNKTFIK